MSTCLADCLGSVEYSSFSLVNHGIEIWPGTNYQDENDDCVLDLLCLEDYQLEDGVEIVPRKRSHEEIPAIDSVQKKKRIRKRSRFPRILKNDLRRFLGLMFANTLNSADFSLISQFFSSFCLSTCTSEYFVRNKPFERLEGVQHTVDHTVQHLSRIPDFVFEIQDNSIVQRLADTGSRVVLKAVLKGTELSPSNLHRATPFQFSAQYTFSLDDCHRILKIEFNGDFDESVLAKFS